MNQERQHSQNITKSQETMRTAFRDTLLSISRFPKTRIVGQEVEGTLEGVEKANRLLDEGYGLITIVPHDSFRDFLENMNFIFQNGSLGEKRIDIPLAKHQYDNPFFNITAKLFSTTTNVNQHPVVTEKTKEKAIAKSEKEGLVEKMISKIGPIKTTNEVRNYALGQRLQQLKHDISTQEKRLMNEYFDTACNTLKDGGIVFVAPEGTRADQLKLSKRTIGTFLTAAVKSKEVDPQKVGIFFLGHELKGVTDYSQKDVKGFNIGRTMIMHPGPCYTLEEAVELSGGFRTIDAWAVETVLPHLVSPYYVSEEIKNKLTMR